MPAGYYWSTRVGKDGAALESQYRLILEHLGKQHGLLGLVFRKAQNKIQDPAKLQRLVSGLLDKEQWMTLSADIKGEAYEGLPERVNRANPCGAWLLGKLQRNAHHRAPARALALLLFQL